MGQSVILLIKTTYYPILAAFGIPANLMTIVILFKGNCGLSKCISVYMVAMATADLLVMLINVMLYHIFTFHFPFSLLALTPICKIILYLTTVTIDLSVWFTVSFTFDRFVIICCQKFRTSHCTQKTAVTITVSFCVMMGIKNIPFLFAFEPQQIINKMQWGCRTRESFFSSPPGAAYAWFHVAWVVWLPFTFIILFNSLTIRRILVGSRARSGLRGTRGKNHQDLEIENRKHSILLLFAVSGSFILLWLMAVVSFAITGLVNTSFYRGDRSNPRYIITEAGNMLKFLSSCPNTCIYAATQRKFREELKEVFKDLWRLSFKTFSKLKTCKLRFPL